MIPTWDALRSTRTFNLVIYVTYPEDPLTGDCPRVIPVTGLYLYYTINVPITYSSTCGYNNSMYIINSRDKLNHQRKNKM